MISRRASAFVTLASLALGGALLQLAGCGSVYGEALPEGDSEAGLPETSFTDNRSSVADADAGLKFCSEQHPSARFCADFDNGSDAGFDSVVGDVTLDPKSFASPPTSALVRATGTSSYLAASPFGAGFAVTQRIAFDIKVDLTPSTSVLFWELGEGAACSFQLGVRGTTAALYVTTIEDGGPIELSSVLAAAPIAQEWSHVSVVLTQLPGAVSVVVKIGNITALEQQTRCVKLATKPAMRVGLTAEASASAAAHYDNILLEEN